MMSLAAWASLTLLVFVSVFLGNLSLFADYDAPGSVIARFMGYSLPRIAHWVLPFSVCIGVVAAQATFSRHVETIAMQACSVSFWRLSVPYIAVSLIAALIMGALSFAVYPIAQRQAEKIEKISIKKKGIAGSFSVNGGRFKVGGDIYHITMLDISSGTMRNITCYRTTSGRLSSIIRARNATWDGAAWKTGRMEVMRPTGSSLDVSAGPGALPLAQPPADLVFARPRTDILTLQELFEYRARLQADRIRSVNLDTQIHSRISFAAAPFIMTLLVLPFGLRFPRAGGIARGISIGIVLSLFYWAVHSAMTSAGMSGYVHPALAAWSSGILALAAGSYLMITRRSTYG